MRSRSLLQQLQSRVGAGVVGFVPNREAGEIWHVVQAWIELALQSNRQLLGAVSDVRKAFESIPRDPLFEVMRLLGLPVPFLSAWRRFLDGLERRFSLHGCLDVAICSNHGLPEGCGLSVVGMVVIDLIWEVYQNHYAASSVPLSYADNLELLALDLGSLMTGFASLETYAELWALELDGPKTFFWSTTAASRSALRRLGKPVLLEASDLGGAMTYCRRTGMGSQRARLEALDNLWPRLRRSVAPLPVKLYILRQAFWAKAFHAIGITLLPFRHIVSLRTRAVRALGFGLAGANPAIRLSLLSGDMTSDPGFYQVVRVLADFRRFLRKSPSLLDHWVTFMRDFDGRWLSGPFSKLLEIFDQLGWTVAAPPCFLDHDGCAWNLLMVCSTTLDTLLRDAWYQRVAREVQHRKDYAGLPGLHWPASRHERRLSALDIACVNAVREGVFLSGDSQGKFDKVKGTTCKFCAQPDTVEHRCLDCPAFTSVRLDHEGVSQHWHDFPRALREHLLPARNPFAVAKKQALCALEDQPCLFEEVTGDHDWIDLFTDGSCLHPSSADLALAAWALVSATHARVLAAGPLAGLSQEINRAELYAAVMALQWTWEGGHHCVLWTDSAYVARGLHCLLTDPDAFDPETNEDLWARCVELLQAIPRGAFQIQHVSGHQDVTTATSPFDEWAAHWNGIADLAARQAHHARPLTCQRICDDFQAHFLASEDAVDKLRALHLAIARQRVMGEMDVEEISEDTHALPTHRSWQSVDDWLDALPLGWITAWCEEPKTKSFSPEAVHSLVQTLQTERERADGAVFLSWLEISFLLHILGFSHPIPMVQQGRTVWQITSMVPAAQHGQLTVGARVRFVKSCLKLLDVVFGCGINFVVGLDLSRFHVHPPLPGMALHVSQSSLRQLDEALSQWTSQRAVRTMNDLYRPLGI